MLLSNPSSSMRKSWPSLFKNEEILPRLFSHKVIFVDTAPTNKGICYECRKMIPKGSPRGWFMDYIYFNKTNMPKPKNWVGNEISVKRLICYDCVPGRMMKAREKLKEVQKHYSNSLKKFKRALKGKKASMLAKSRNALEELQRDGL